MAIPSSYFSAIITEFFIVIINWVNNVCFNIKKANQIINGALATARHLNLAALTVVVLDENGFIKAIQREDGCAMLKQEIALAKAWGAVHMGMSSRSLAVVAEQRPAFMNALVDISGVR